MEGGVNMTQKTILAIDLKSFYASCECIDRNLDPFTTPLIVADKSRGKGTIVLAVSPYLKNLGIPSRCRVYDVPNIPNLIFAQPRMERYIQLSVKVLSIYLDYVDITDMHVYSVDEAFLDVTNYLKGRNMTPTQFARAIIKDIKNKTGLTVTCGIGENLFTAKVAMDIEAKHKKDFLAHWTYDDIKSKLWNLTPLSKMWGIGSHLERRLNALGMYTVGDIACADPYFLKRKLGVIGEEIYSHANGIDKADIKKPYTPSSSCLGIGQVLLRDYLPLEGELIIREEIEELILRMRKKNFFACGFSIGVQYKDNTGFNKQVKLDNPTRSSKVISDLLLDIYFKNVNRDNYLRGVFIQAFKLTPSSSYQTDLFSTLEEFDKEENFYKVEEDIHSLYGKKSLFKATALLDNSTYFKRINQIGGHNK